MKKSKKDFRTPLGKSLGLGSAHTGTKTYRAQLLTSLLNIPLFFIFVFVIIAAMHQDYEGARSLIANPFIASFFALMLLAGIYHMKLGMQVILEDYISHHLLRMLMLTVNTAFCFILGALSILSLIKVALGG